MAAADSFITLAVNGPDPVLAELLTELATHTPAHKLRVVTDAALADADITLFSVVDAAALEKAREDAKKAQTLSRIAMLVTAEDMPEESASKDFIAVFRKPVRLAALLDAGLTAFRISRIKTPRQLAPHIFFNPFTRTVDDREKGASQQLSAREAAFLLAVVETGAAGLSREQAITEVWGYHRDVDSHAVETAVYRLRQKLQPLFGAQDVLASVGGVYLWKGDSGLGIRDPGLESKD